MHQFGAATDVGNVRDNNEDSYVCDPDRGLWIVADGMGGLGFGEVASAISTFTVTTMVRDGHGVNQAIEAAHRNIKEYAESDGMGTNMGTTIVLLLSLGSMYNVFWVGDSRAYILNGSLRQITTDHSVVQSLIEQGELTETEAENHPHRNAVTRALGVRELDTVRADSISERWQPGQKLLLCSDGLTDCVRNSDIETILNGSGTDQELADLLVEKALENGGKDNVTVIIVTAPPESARLDSDTEIPEYISSPDRADTDSDGSMPAMGRRLNETRQMPREHSPIPAAAELVPQTSHGSRIPVAMTGLPLGYLVPIAIVLLLMFVSVSVRDSSGRGLARDAVVHQSSASLTSTPRTRVFPEVDFVRSGTLLSLGVYSDLDEAESFQQQLSVEGLYALIEIRPSVEGRRYEMTIGPLADETSLARVVATLESNKWPYAVRSGEPWR